MHSRGSSVVFVAFPTIVGLDLDPQGSKAENHRGSLLGSWLGHGSDDGWVMAEKVIDKWLVYGGL